MLMSRRRMIVGLAGLIAAPAVVRVASLMPVRSFVNELTIPPGETLYMMGGSSSDMMISSFVETIGSGQWPSTTMGFIRHRRDLADLGEPYRSQVLARQALMKRATGENA
jgi:hypothetical protein